MEDVEGNLPVGHALDKAGDGGLVVVGGERGAEPEAEGPGRGEGGPAGEGGVAVEHFLGGGAVDEEVVELLAGDAELDALDLFRADLKRDQLGVVDKDAVAAVGHVEGNVLVGQLAAGAAVVVPDVDDLAVFDKGGEAFAEAVDALADAEIELLDGEAALRACP